MQLDKGYYSSPRWSYELLDCAMPMTFDTYSNCAHQCVYCFAFFQRGIGHAADDYLHHRVRSVNVDRVKKMFIDPDQHAGQFAEYIKRRYVLQWGGLSDGFDWYERKFRKSLELLRFFREIDYPVSISTKGTWFLDDPEYVEVLRGAANTHWKYSIITLDEGHARKLEAGTPAPRVRFDALSRLSGLGVGAVTLRFRPYIIGASDVYTEEMVALAKDSGCISVTTEFLCIERRATKNHLARYQAISDVVGYDVWEFYLRNSYSGSGLMRLNYDIKRPYIARFEEVCKQHDLAFYVSDAHHKEASAAAGCCGLPSTGPLSNYNRGQFAEAILIAKRNGKVHWSDIAADAAWLDAVPYNRAEGYNNGSTRGRAQYMFHSVTEFMRDMWNRPKSWASPARYFGGVLVPGDKDDQGDIVYYYNQAFVDDGTRIGDMEQLKVRVSDSREQMSADGAALGHVAFPVYVCGTGADEITAQLALERINAVVTETPHTEAHGVGDTAYWVLRHPLPAGERWRPVLSAKESAAAGSQAYSFGEIVIRD